MFEELILLPSLTMTPLLEHKKLINYNHLYQINLVLDSHLCLTHMRAWNQVYSPLHYS